MINIVCKNVSISRLIKSYQFHSKIRDEYCAYYGARSYICDLFYVLVLSL